MVAEHGSEISARGLEDERSIAQDEPAIARFLKLGRWRVRHRLVALVATIALPLNLLVIVGLASLANSSIEAQRVSLLFSARSIAAVVDAKLAKFMAIAADLQSSPTISTGDLVAFETEARQALTGVPEAWVVLTDAVGQQLVNTSPEVSSPLPALGPEGAAAQRQAIASRTIVVTDVQRGTAIDDWIASVKAPVFKEGQPFRVVSVVFRLSTFLTVLGGPEMPASWLSGIIDGNGRFVARIPDNDTRVGQLAAEGWRRAKHIDGISENQSLEGDWVVTANARSKLSGWATAIAVPRRELSGSAWQAVRWPAILGATISLLSLLLAALVARSISKPLEGLRISAGALVKGSAVDYRPESREARELWTTLRRAVADRDRADQEARQLSARMAAIVTSSFDAIVTKSLDGTITGWNLSAERMFGYSTEEIVGRSIRVLIPADRQSEEDNIIAHLQRGEIVLPFETVRLAKGGRPIDVSVTISPIRDGEGKLVGASTAARDISERKESEKQLRESEARLSQIINSVDAFIGLLDSSGRVIEVNSRALEAARASREEIIGRDMAQAPWWSYSPDASKCMSDIVRRCLAGETVRCDLRFSANGEMRWMDFQASPVLGADGRATAVVPSGLDITDRKRSEEQVNVLMLEVNHRAKNLLGVILAIARQTLSTNPAGLAKFTQRIQALAVNLDLLMKSDWQGIDMGPLVHGQLAPIVDPAGKRVAADGPDIRLNKEAAQAIGMALHELATNAVKYGALSNERGRIAITWTCDDGAFAISWQEHDGPRVEPPTQRGFGHTVLTRLAEAAVSGHVSLDYDPPGLRWQLVCAMQNAIGTGRTTSGEKEPS